MVSLIATELDFCDFIDISTPMGVQSVKRLNAYKVLSFITQNDFIIGPDECFQTALDLCLDGGSVFLLPGIYDQTDSFLLIDKDITIKGSDDINNPSIIKGRLIIENVTSDTVIENLTFMPRVNQNSNTHGIKLINATPILSNLIFYSDGVRIHTDIEVTNALTSDVLKISNSTFTGSLGIYFRSGIQNSFSKLVIENSSFIYDESNYPRTAIDFIGTDIDIRNSTFTIFDDEYENVQQIVIGLTPFISSPEKEINIIGNEFKTFRGSQAISNAPRSNQNNIKVYGDNSYFLNMERNKFVTYNSSGVFYPVTVVYLEDSPSQGDSKATFINNTDVIFGAFEDLCTDHQAYDFLQHNGNAVLINNLLTGGIYSSSPSATNDVSYNWFVQGVPINIDGIAIYSGEPNITKADLQPIWNETIKSGLIGSGHPALYDTYWYDDDPANNDPGNVRRAIGAVPAITYGSLRHELDVLPVLKNPPHGGYHWISFPYTDKVFMPPTYPEAELYYVLHEYNENELFTTFPNLYLDSMKWLYDNVDGLIYHDGITWEGDIERILDSRHGYKVKMKPNMTKDIISRGFLPSGDDAIMNLKATAPGDTLEVWVGYFMEKSEIPYVALADVLDDLIEIKTQRWALNRHPIFGWNYLYSGDPKFNFGEAVSLKYISGKDDINFTWNVSMDPIDEIYEHPIPIYFEFEEQIDYIPIYIYLPDDIAIMDGEIGMSVNGQIVGAEVITGELIQLNSYSIGMDLENAEIEFLLYEYGSRSGEKTIEDNYLVLSQTVNRFEEKNYSLKNKNLFHVFSFRNEDEKNINDVPAKTILEGNYPNPFNPSTTIAYNLAQTGNVSLKIYNIRGQLVKSLVDEEQNAGRHEVLWEGDDNNSRNVASGIYFYRLQTGNGKQIRRMVLLK